VTVSQDEIKLPHRVVSEYPRRAERGLAQARPHLLELVGRRADPKEVSVSRPISITRRARICAGRNGGRWSANREISTCAAVA